MRERWALLAASAEFHEGIRTWPDGTIRELFRITLPITQAAPKTGPTTVNLERRCPWAVKLSVPELPCITAINQTGIR
jgi:hypothetical protein